MDGKENTNAINYKELYEIEKTNIEILNIIIEKKNKEIHNLNKIIEAKNKEIEILKKPKGFICSLNGNNYEKCIYNIVKNCFINNKLFNTQKENELAGSSSKNDIECNFINEKDIGIEIKKSKTPDWMQCIINFNDKTNTWETSKKSKNPSQCSIIFTELINNINLYNGNIPPFIKKEFTYDEWIEEKNNWNDVYIDIPSDTISRLYSAKKCKYIQISDGYGLYHLGDDICEFNVPFFEIEQQLRIRIKIHKKINIKGFCNLSVTVACQPKNIKKLNPSKYSLDNKDKLPFNLLFNQQ